MALFHIKIFHVVLRTIATFKKKNSTCGLQISHIWIILLVSGSNGLTGVTHVLPCYNALFYYIIRYIQLQIHQTTFELFRHFIVYVCLNIVLKYLMLLVRVAK